MSRCVEKKQCSKCGGSKSLQIFKNDDGSLSGFCFKCEYRYGEKMLESTHESRPKTFSKQLLKEEVLMFPYRTDNDRGIEAEVYARFGIRVGINEITGEADTVYYPYYIKSSLCGFKTRGLPKEFKASVGSISDADLFGKNLCTFENKTIVITEGEEDAIAVAQVIWSATGKERWPNVVSLVNGASLGKGFEKEVKFLNKFSKVIACFDDDEPGKAALAKLAMLINPDKLYTMDLSEKDASDCIVNGKSAEILAGFKRPVKYKPQVLVTISEAVDKYRIFRENDRILFPEDWEVLNEMTYGLRPGEINTFTSGTGMGKTQFFRELIHHVFKSTKENIAIISLEESLENTMDGILSIHLNKNITIPDFREEVPETIFRQGLQDLQEGDRISFYSIEKGNYGSGEIQSFITYAATMRDCKYIFLDHISLINFDETNLSEREKLDKFMVKLRQLAQSLNVCILMIAHLRKSEVGGKNFESGALPSEDDLKGTGSLKQMSNVVYALRRNKNCIFKPLKNMTQVHVLKNRFSGLVGEADYFVYDFKKARMAALNLSIEERALLRNGLTKDIYTDEQVQQIYNLKTVEECIEFLKENSLPMSI